MIKSRFIIEKGPMEGKVFLLENRLTIGRTAENDIHLSDITVSKQHAVAYFNEGQPIVEDLGSFNGTFVNERSVKKTVLRSGDALRVGSIELRFSQGEEVPKDTQAKRATDTQRRKRIGEHLIAAGVLNEESLRRALEIQGNKKKRIGQILIDMGVISDEEIADALASQLNIPLLRLKNLEIPEETITLVTAQTAEAKLLIPVKTTENRLLVAMADPLDFEAIKDIRFQTGMSIEVAVSPEGDIWEAFNRHYIPKDVWY